MNKLILASRSYNMGILLEITINNIYSHVNYFEFNYIQYIKFLGK